MNAYYNSKVLGDIHFSLKISELPISDGVRPVTTTQIDRDNGQITAMNCVTSAEFKEVARMDLTVVNESKVVGQKQLFANASVDNSYAMQTESEVCQASELHEMKSAHLQPWSSDFVIPMDNETNQLFLSVTMIPLAQTVAATVSGDENRISLDWLDLLADSPVHKRRVQFSVYRRTGAGTSFLEHGQAELELR